MDENKKGSTLYVVLGVATLVVAIIGATFAYFSASANSTGDAITGQTDNDLASALSLTVEKVAFENADATSANLVPTNLEATLNGVNSAVTSKCVSNGYTGCHLYKITALSTKDLANASVRLTALNVDAKDTASWKYIIYKNDGSSNSATELVADGKGYTPELETYIHQTIKKVTDYEYITVHFLRHANATLLLNSGVDLKIVSAHLGHNDISTTADIYADVLKSQQQKVAQIIEFNLEND